MTAESNGRTPSTFRNFTSLVGVAIALAALVSITLLFFVEMAGSKENPYLGILIYILFPAFLVLGIAIAFFGMWLERRRRRTMEPSEVASRLSLDLNNPQQRRRVMIFVVVLFVFLMVSAFGSYRAYEYTESVTFCGQLCHVPMEPQFVAHQNSPHARIRCVECHVGPGADWYVKSKFNGARQLYSVLMDTYPRPIPTPVHNLRPAQDTCEHCHWPDKNFGVQLKEFNHYGYDEKNTHNLIRLLVNTGGGAGAGSGIHWHMNIANEIVYASIDDKRQELPWVRMKDRDGNVEEYFLKDSPLGEAEMRSLPQRKMDCVDCHNRQAHAFAIPDRSVNEAMLAGKLDPALPYIKARSVEALSKTYASTEEAVNSIASFIDEFYRTKYPDLYSAKRDEIHAAVTELQRIYRTSFFPVMKTDWQAHQDNVGHYYSTGCFRCHDGKHVSKTGKIIRNDCRICHTVLDQSQNGIHSASGDGSFKHPVELGQQAKFNCTRCHSGDRPFQHPVNLGDISQFKCTECHALKNSSLGLNLSN